MRTRRASLAALVPLVAVLAACSGTGGEVTEDPATGDNRPTATVTVTAPAEDAAPVTETVTVTVTAEPEAAPEPTTEPPPGEGGGGDGDGSDGGDEVTSGTATFGQTWAYDDGLQVTVSEPVPHESGQFGIGGEDFEHQLRFTVTIVNQTGENFDPGLVFVTVQSGNREGEQIFDAGNGLEGTPTTTLLDGREAVFDLAFGVDDPEDLVMEVRPSFEHDSAIFTS